MGKCAAFTVSGTPCRKQAMRDSKYCWTHDPSFEEERQRAAARGGKTGGRGRPSEIAEIKGELHQLAADVVAGEVVRGDAAVVSQIYNTILGAIRTDLKRREQEELVERLEALEGVLSERKAGSGYYA